MIVPVSVITSVRVVMTMPVLVLVFVHASYSRSHLINRATGVGALGSDIKLPKTNNGFSP